MGKVCYNTLTFTKVNSVGKDILHAVFSKEYRGRPFNLFDKFAQVEARYNEFKLLHEKQSLPKLSTYSSWKGHQIRLFFLYLACPLFHSFLPKSPYTVIQQFVEGTLCISKNSISDSDIETAIVQYKLFSLGINSWGDEFMNINEHNIVHLPEQVRRTGPLWTTSGFHTESDVGEIVKSKLFIQCFD